MIYAGPDAYLSQHKGFLLLIHVSDDVRTLTAMKYLEIGRNIIACLVMNIHWMSYALISSKLAEVLKKKPTICNDCTFHCLFLRRNKQRKVQSVHIVGVFLIRLLCTVWTLN
jgi:hypothetical protein